MTNVSAEQIETAKKNIEKFSNLKTYFEEKWLNSQLKIDKLEKHPIFWIITDIAQCSKLSKDLSVLTNCSKFKSIIKKLKDKTNFYSYLTEVDVISYYYRKYNAENIEYEPEVTINNKIKRPDFKLAIDGEEYYFEIFTVFKEEIQQKEENLLNEIENKLKNLNLPYEIIAKLNKGFTEQNIDEFIDFIKELSEKKLEQEEEKFEFPKNGEKLVDISFFKTNKNGIVYLVGRPQWLGPFDRIKVRILNKLKTQLPENTRNIVVINLSHLEPVHIPNLYDPFIKDVSNEIFAHEKGKFVSMIIVYTDNDYKNTKNFNINCSARKKIDDDIIKRIIN